MKIANHNGRLAIVLDDGIADVAQASDGRFGPDPMSAFDDWSDFAAWAGTISEPTGALDEALLGPPVPRPRQVFGIGLNYRKHAAESGMDVPSVPATFTKFPTAISGPFADIPIHHEAVDWEVELVAVVGVRAEHVSEGDAWAHLAGVTVGQDISDRTLQFAAGMQFSLGKSRPGYAPIGPWLVTPDELDDPDDLALGCAIDGETVQDARTDDLIFDVPQLVAELSSILPLLPGDVIFTGTPEGVGMARTPPQGLAPGNVLDTWVDGVGRMRNRCVTPTR